MKRNIVILLFLFFVAVIFYVLPKPELQKPFSYIVYASNGDLLDFQVANDGQWRLRLNNDSLPLKYVLCLMLYEDKNFLFHHGVDPIAIVRALYLNAKHKRKFSGGSTLTMQVARMFFNHRERNIVQKIKEILLACYLELKYTKKEILWMYMQHAPFGGNVVGIESASYKYFQRPSTQLSWAESALLAVLPKNPANINLQKNNSLLLKRRNNLLYRLFQYHIIDEQTFLLAIEESLPQIIKEKPHRLPHLLHFLKNKYPQTCSYKTYINESIQQLVYDIVLRYRKENQANNIRNIAALVVELPSKKVIAYVGNYHDKGSHSDAFSVNMIEAKRSGGSVLKPLLYATMLDNGELLPSMLLPDIPIQIGSYAPKNFNLTYDGAVRANQALARSLNVSAVKMLQQYGIQRFIHFLQNMGFSTINKTQDYYGLSLILGGCEIKLSNMANAYANMACVLMNQKPTTDLNYFEGQYNTTTELPLGKGAIWLTFKAMNDVERPEGMGYWYLFSHNQKIAWKTGTSFGFRDAWAIGLTPDYLVSVWVGNATGESNPQLTGIKKAAPVMFDIFAALPVKGNDFPMPYDDLQVVKTCKQSGYIPSMLCNEVVDEIMVKTSLKLKPCIYHKLIFLDSTGNYRVHSDCEEVAKMKKQIFFVLPPTMEYYFKKRNPTYRSLPPYREDCLSQIQYQQNIDIVYPQVSTNLYLPRNLDGSLSSFMFEAIHRQKDVVIFWYLDNMFVGETRQKHVLSLQPSLGRHILTLQDEFGETKEVEFTVVYAPETK